MLNKYDFNGIVRYGMPLTLNGTDTDLILSKHACLRAVERLKELGVTLDTSDQYLAAAGILARDVCQHRLVQRYLFNTQEMCGRTGRSVIIELHEERGFYMTYILEINGECVKLVTMYSKYNTTNEEHIYLNKKTRQCWVYDEAIRFTTKSGMVTWI